MLKTTVDCSRGAEKQDVLKKVEQRIHYLKDLEKRRLLTQQEREELVDLEKSHKTLQPKLLELRKEYPFIDALIEGVIEYVREFLSAE